MSWLISLKEILGPCSGQGEVEIAIMRLGRTLTEPVKDVFLFGDLLLIKKEKKTTIYSGPFSIYYDENPSADRLV